MPAADWRLVNSQPFLFPRSADYGGDPAVEQEYGVKSLELRTYQLGKQQTQVLVEAAADATAAYGLLTFYRTPAMTPEKEIQLAVGDANQTFDGAGKQFHSLSAQRRFSASRSIIKHC